MDDSAQIFGVHIKKVITKKDIKLLKGQVSSFDTELLREAVHRATSVPEGRG